MLKEQKTQTHQTLNTLHHYGCDICLVTLCGMKITPQEMDPTCTPDCAVCTHQAQANHPHRNC